MDVIRQFFRGYVVEPHGGGLTEEFLSCVLFGIEDELCPSLASLIQRHPGMETRQVCQYQFLKNDIAWICKTCQSDETCVMCNVCFQDSSHEGHEVFFYHSQMGGCCDCGDAAAWMPSGFCTRHGRVHPNPLDFVPQDILSRGSSLLKELVKEFVSFADFVSRSFEAYAMDDKENADSGQWACILYRDDMHSPHDVNADLSRVPFINQSDISGIREALSLDGSACLFLSNVGGDGILEVNSISASLRQQGYRVSVVRVDYMERQEAMLTGVKWLTNISSLSDGMCRLVGDAFLENENLTKLIGLSSNLDQRLLSALSVMFLTMMADLNFKSGFTTAYARAFSELSDCYGRGIGLQEVSLFGLSVQFLNRQKNVFMIVNEHHFFDVLVNALASMLSRGARVAKSGLLHQDICCEHRRYNPILADLRVIFTIPTTNRRFVADVIDQLLDLFESFQGMHPQAREVGVHVEFESREWMTAFNLAIGFSGMLESLTTWLRSEDSLTENDDPSTVDSVSGSVILPSATSFIQKLLAKLLCWVESQVKLVNDGTAVHSITIEEIQHIPWLGSFHDDNCWAMRVGQIAPILGNRPTRTFHLLLHRLWASAVSEAFKNPGLNDFLKDMSVVLDADRNGLRTEQEDHEPSLAIHPLLIDHPLDCLALCAEIRAGLWVRNGLWMRDQAINYDEPPFSKISKDLDIISVQFFAARTHRIRTILPLVPRIFHSFGVLQYLKGSSLGGLPQSEVEACMHLFDEALKIIIQISSDLPLPPSVDPKVRVLTGMRRDLIHKLCGGAFTMSQLLECALSVPDHPIVTMTEVEALICEVAEVGGAPSLRSMEAPKLSLRVELWSHYNPVYHNMPSRIHQEIVETRPKAPPGTALVLPPDDVHPCFQGLRTSILHDPILLKALRLQVLAYAAQTCKQSIGPLQTKYTRFQNLPFCSDTTWFRTIHILTLLAHNLEHPSFDESESDTKTKFPEFLLDSYIHKTEGDEITEKYTMLSGLLDIRHQPAMSKCGENNKTWLDFILSKFTECSPKVMEILTNHNASRESEERTRMLEDRKRLARERSVQLMRSRAESFAATMDDDDDDMIPGGASSSSLASENSAIGTSEQLEVTCIICHDATDSKRRLGHQVLCQTSYVCPREPSRAGGGEAVLSYSPSVSPQKTFDMYVSSCSHAMHFDCFDSFYAEVVDRNDVQLNGTLLDTSKGQFLCPCCKRLSNCLVPYHSLQRMHQRKRPRDHGSTKLQQLESIGFNDLVESCVATTLRLKPDPTRQSSSSELDFWATRFLGSFLCPITSEHFTPRANSFALLYRIELATAAVTYSVRCSMLTPFPPGHHLATGDSDCLDEHDCLSSVMGSIGSTMKETGLRGQFFDALIAAMTFPVENLADSVDIPSQYCEVYDQEVGKYKWLHRFLLKTSRGILSLPLLELLTLVLCNTIDSPETSPSDCHGGDPAIVRIIAIAALVQIFGMVKREPCRQNYSDVEFVVGDDLLVLIEPLLLSLNSCYEEYSTDSPPSPWTSFESQRVLKSFAAFLRLFTQQIYRSGVIGIIDSHEIFGSSSGDGVLAARRIEFYLKVVGLDTMLCDPAGQAGVMHVVSKWIRSTIDPMRNLHPITGLLHHGPPLDVPYFSAPTKLVRLPQSYAQLHSDVKALASLDFPAICLLCGAVLDGGGVGAVTAHCALCSGGTGIVFLLHQSMILLLHGNRASYFPSPYVDQHGERQRQMRGKPLFLESRRYSILEDLFRGHEVPREIASKRSTLPQIVRLNHY